MIHLCSIYLTILLAFSIISLQRLLLWIVKSLQMSHIKLTEYPVGYISHIIVLYIKLYYHMYRDSFYTHNQTYMGVLRGLKETCPQYLNVTSDINMPDI